MVDPKAKKVYQGLLKEQLRIFLDKNTSRNKIQKIK